MVDPNNLVLIGSSHISIQSVKEIEERFKELKPDIVAVELDKDRYHTLLTKPKGKVSFYKMMKVGFSGFLFAMIGSWVSKRLGRMVNMEPGADMMHAIKVAQKNQTKIALIDQHINITLSRFSRYLTFREKMRMVGDVIRGLIFPKKELEKYGIEKIDLSKVPSDKLIRKLIGGIKKRYPNIYKVLIHERNVYMANRLYKIMLSHPGHKILAVVGAGHKEGMEKILKKKLNNPGDVIYSYDFSTSS